MRTVRQHWVCITLKMRTPQNYVKNADTTEAYFNKSHLLRRVRFNKRRFESYSELVDNIHGTFNDDLNINDFVQDLHLEAILRAFKMVYS